MKVDLFFFLFSLSSYHMNGGGLCGVKRDIDNFFRKELKLPEKLAQFTDIRKHPVIDLKDIIVQIFLMPFYGVTSLLGIDRISRKKYFKKLFRCKRKMVSSDSTIKRVLNWLDETESKSFLSSMLTFMEEHNLLTKRLTEGSEERRIGIFDGSVMGGHYHETFSLAGKISYPVMVENCGKRGKELPTAYKMIDEGRALLGRYFPDLILADSLYFNSNFFDKVREGDSHILIKSADPAFRNVLMDAKLEFDHKDFFHSDIRDESGFDLERMCSYKIETASENFAGYPVLVSHLTEFYPKRKKEQNSESWIITTDLSLLPNEIREAAHFRWQIENNVFKRISHFAGTKKFYCKNNIAFFNLLRIFFAAIAVFDAFLTLIKENTNKFEKIRCGIKPTWKNMFSIFGEYFGTGIFRY